MCIEKSSCTEPQTMFCCCRSRDNTAASNVLPGVPSSETAVSDLDASSIDMAVLIRRTNEGADRAVEAGATQNSMRASICLKLTVFVGILVILASGVPALVLWLKAHEQLVEEIERRLLTVSILRQEQLRDYLTSQTDKTSLISTRLLINAFLANHTGANRTSAKIDLSSATEVTPDLQGSAIYDRYGSLAFSTDDSLFQKALGPADVDSIGSEGLKIGLPVHMPDGWIYNISRGIFEKKTLIGVLVALVNASKLENLVHDRTGLQATGELLIGVPINSSAIQLLFPPLKNTNTTQFHLGGAMALAVNGESGILRLRDYSGAKVIAAYRPVGFLHWGLLAKLDVHEAYAPIRSIRIVIIITIVTLLFVGVMASLGLAKVFTSPIVDLGRAAAALGQGDMKTRVKMGTILLRDEIADLMDTFNSMAHQIASHQLILEHKVRERTSDLAQANDGLAKEIEERRKVEIELEKAKDVAIAANRSKSEFLANMSHEIRTPLNAIINFTELCLDTRITPEQQEHLDYVRFAAQHLLRIITDILDFSKIEAGKLEMEEIQFSLFDQLEHAVSVLAARALKNGLELCCRFDANVPDEIMGDPGRLLQILVNLIGNGIKFTKKGEVVVCVSVKSKSVDAVELLFSVRDTGLGIPESKQPLLFQAFSQVDSSTQRLYGGTGLGLVISSKLAAAMGGRMWVESDGEEDHGSTFYFTASFHIPPACNLSYTPRVDMFKDISALVVDDNETSQKILVDMLKNWGMIADGVSSVEAAEITLQRAEKAGQKYNVLLLDMWLNGTDASELVYLLQQRPNLLGRFCASARFLPIDRDVNVKHPGEVLMQPQNPGSNDISEYGVDSEVPADIQHSNANLVSKSEDSSLSVLCSQERGAPLDDIVIQKNQACQAVAAASRIHGCHFSENNSLPFIMLTSVNHSDATRCKELGINLHTSKPIKRALLIRVLETALGAQGNSSVMEGEVSKGSSGNPSKSLHILVAEDNLVNQRVAVVLLQKWGHTTVLARNGAEAVEQCTKEAFDLILMDVQMPVCDGFEATAKIRELENAYNRDRRTPIVAMTARAMSGDGDRCIAAGMDFYISKPLNSLKLQELLQTVATGPLKRMGSHKSPRASMSMS